VIFKFSLNSSQIEGIQNEEKKHENLKVKRKKEENQSLGKIDNFHEQQRERKEKRARKEENFFLLLETPRNK
jgi:hypothetical protein